MISKVLIVDDAVPIHTLLRAHLPEERFDLRSAYNGDSGLQMIAAWRPDLVLLDVDMPTGADGFEICRRLREELSTSHLPVIFLTGSSQIEQKVRGLQLGGTDYITKPFHHAELRARVDVALRTKSRLNFLAQQRVSEFMEINDKKTSSTMTTNRRLIN